MPFWWRRSRKFWWGKGYRRPAYKRRYKRRKLYRQPSRRRRRRRRRRRKVRRKRQKITVKQWQPETIIKCKIKGITVLVLGAEGKQLVCYTNVKNANTPPKAPGGGGFGCEQFSLESLYTDWLARRNIWTKTNDYKDLVRFTGATFYLYKHPTTDFVFNYNNQPPFLLEKDYYNDLHPQSLLLARHHKIIPSRERKPLGKSYVKIKIKPPKQMLTKWFFQQDFATQGLLTIYAAAANLQWAYYNPDQQSRCLTLYSFNIKFFANTDWAATHTGTQMYFPYNQWPHSTGLNFWTIDSKGNKTAHLVNPKNYHESVGYTTGFFQQAVLQAKKITQANETDPKQYDTYPAAMSQLPIAAFRYNPEEDTGQGNVVWLTSTLTNSHWDRPQLSDLVIVGKPLWLAFYGFESFIQKTKHDKGWLLSGFYVCRCPYLKTLSNTTQQTYAFIDIDFIQGKLPYGETITDQKKALWYPNVENQVNTIANLVECGPYVPKLFNIPSSTWQLTYKYHFYFKWGGSYISDQLVHNPQDQGKYPIPNIVIQPVQISDPLKQTYKTMLRHWDYRRGIITTTALKRMSENLQTDSSLSSDESETPKKKKKITSEIPFHQEEKEEIQKCLLSLFEENTCQEPENLQQLIQQQQQQQQKLKHNILKLLIDLKKKQRILQLQTGVVL
nr:hypothetical protein [Torque teno midi virus]